MDSAAFRMKLTKTQEQALDHSRNLSLVAGAGSGKTTVLTQRYLDILSSEPGLSVRNILAITFTERAAIEMKQRIRDEIAARCQGPDRARWESLREELILAPISTIHSFCASLLKAHPLEAGIDPDFSTLDEPESTILLEETVAEVTDPLNADLVAELRFLWRRWPPGRLRHVLRSLLGAREISETHLRSAAQSSPEELAQSWAKAVSDAQEQRVRLLSRGTDLLPLLRELAAACGSCADDDFSELMAAGADAVARLDADDDASSALARLTPFLTTGKDFDPRKRFPGSKGRWTGEDIDSYRRAAASLAALLSPHAALLSIHPDADSDELAATHSRSLSVIATAAFDRYQQRKDALAALDFADLQLKALTLLETHPHVAERCRRLYRFVMVDEFQDTNSIQWRLIRLLVSDGGALAPDRLFIVGDPLQSIYGFRLAEVEVLEEASEEMSKVARSGAAKAPATIRMDENFRSQPNIIGFTNLLFSRLIEVPGTFREPFEPPFEPLRPMRVQEPGLGSVGILVGLRPRELPPFLHEASLIAEGIIGMVERSPARTADRSTSLLRDARFGDVAILLRRRTHMAELERALRAAGVPFIVAGGIGFFAQQEIADLVNFLRFLATPWDDLATAAILRSPLFAATDEALFRLALSQERMSLWEKVRQVRDYAAFSPGDTEALSQMRDVCRRLLALVGAASPEELVDLLLRETGGWGIYAAGPRGRQAIANIRKFLSVLRQLNSPALPLPDLVRILDLQSRRGAAEPEAPLHLEEEDAVRIMTIHQAKGLEFPIVFLPDLARKLILASQVAMVDRDLGVGLALPSSGDDRESSIRALIEMRSRRREIAEEQRLLYVGCTRARDHLVLSGEVVSGSSLSSANWLGRMLAVLGVDSTEERDEEISPSEPYCAAFQLRVVSPGEQLPKPVPIPRIPEVSPESEPAEEDLAVISSLEPLGSYPSRQQLSVTQISEYIRCPRAYYLAAELGAREFDGAESPALARGTFIHRLLQLAWDKPDAQLEGLSERLVQGFQGLSPEDSRSLSTEGVDAVLRARRSRAGEMARRAESVLTEVQMSLRHKDAILSGVLDRLCIMPDRKFVVVDFKTDHVSKKDVPKKGEGYRIQLLLYGIGVARAFSAPLDKVELLLYFTRPGEEIAWGMDDQQADAALRQLEEIAGKIASGIFPPSPSKDACGHCIQKSLCPSPQRE